MFSRVRVSYKRPADVEIHPDARILADIQNAVQAKNRALRKISALGVELAIYGAIPIAVERGGKTYCFANLDTLKLANRLPAQTDIPVLVVDPVPPRVAGKFSAQLALLNALARGLDERFASGSLRQLRACAAEHGALESLSPEFGTISSFARVTETNRRDFSRKQKAFQSEFLTLGEAGRG